MWVPDAVYIINKLNPRLLRGSRPSRRKMNTEYGMKYRKCFRLGLIERYEKITPLDPSIKRDI